MERAPDGQASTWFTIVSVSCPSRTTHGRRRGSNTFGNPRAQIAEWMQSDGCHTTVISPFEYRLMVSLSLTTTSQW